MSNEDDASDPQNLQIHCKSCRKLMPVAFADLRENNFITCPLCDHSFTPDINVEVLLNLIKQAEDAMLSSTLIM